MDQQLDTSIIKTHIHPNRNWSETLAAVMLSAVAQQQNIRIAKTRSNLRGFKYSIYALRIENLRGFKYLLRIEKFTTVDTATVLKFVFGSLTLQNRFTS